MLCGVDFHVQLRRLYVFSVVGADERVDVGDGTRTRRHCDVGVLHVRF